MLLEKLDGSVWLNNIILLFRFLGGKKKAKETSEKNYVFMWIYKKYILQSTFSEILDGNGKRETCYWTHYIPIIYIYMWISLCLSEWKQETLD